MCHIFFNFVRDIVVGAAHKVVSNEPLLPSMVHNSMRYNSRFVIINFWKIVCVFSCQATWFHEWNNLWGVSAILPYETHLRRQLLLNLDEIKSFLFWSVLRFSLLFPRLAFFSWRLNFEHLFHRSRIRYMLIGLISLLKPRSHEIVTSIWTLIYIFIITQLCLYIITPLSFLWVRMTVWNKPQPSFVDGGVVVPAEVTASKCGRMIIIIIQRGQSYAMLGFQYSFICYYWRSLINGAVVIVRISRVQFGDLGLVPRRWLRLCLVVIMSISFQTRYKTDVAYLIVFLIIVDIHFIYI